MFIVRINEINELCLLHSVVMAKILVSMAASKILVSEWTRHKQFSKSPCSFLLVTSENFVSKSTHCQVHIKDLNLEHLRTLLVYHD